jgi:hypothetical protein
MSGSWKELRARIKRQSIEIERQRAVLVEIEDENRHLKAVIEPFAAIADSRQYEGLKIGDDYCVVPRAWLKTAANALGYTA